ncbi:DUF3597 domain-containing protein [Polaromonas sp. SM01]|uniref:DUF3597 domain-containing protein n=1 Tax=Polaromonas sp. SM01 TaxID=3085630 RepID=UPI002981D804|nr:DUF3597 domain-containing protein [Polaromonas sp. SM01]MDW5442684.1 DUF3597 domain-containing protein [Polaromonas sp. SM01]
MSILSKIFGKIFPSAQAAPAESSSALSPDAAAAASADTAAAAAAAVAAAMGSATIAVVDVEAVLNEMASNNPEKLNWKTSIVDLMKLLKLDSSLAERKELSKELGYTGDTNDSATMNIWLHKQVMIKLAANGGKLPADLQG